MRVHVQIYEAKGLQHLRSLTAPSGDQFSCYEYIKILVLCLSGAPATVLCANEEFICAGNQDGTILVWNTHSDGAKHSWKYDELKNGKHAPSVVGHD